MANSLYYSFSICRYRIGESTWKHTLINIAVILCPEPCHNWVNVMIIKLEIAFKQIMESKAEYTMALTISPLLDTTKLSDLIYEPGWDLLTHSKRTFLSSTMPAV